MDLKSITSLTPSLFFSTHLVVMGLMASSAAMASELHPIEDVSLIDSGEETISIRAHLLMEDSCAYPTVSTATVDNFSGVINLKQTARDPEVFCNQVITERETNFEINTNELTSGEYEIIDEFGKESLGTLYIGPRGSIDLLKFKEHLL